jgi:Ca2+/Na+ antiporter
MPNESRFIFMLFLIALLLFLTLSLITFLTKLNFLYFFIFYTLFLGFVLFLSRPTKEEYDPENDVFQTISRAKKIKESLRK